MSTFNFKELEKGAELLKFAQGHDWFIKQTENGVLVLDRRVGHGEIIETEEHFDDLQKLKAWAGY